MQPMKADDDNLTMALRSIECELRGLAGRPDATDAPLCAVYEDRTGLCCVEDLSYDEATKEARLLNHPYDAMLGLIKAYVEGTISQYGVRVAASARGED
jgi:hypothetical protein